MSKVGESSRHFSDETILATSRTRPAGSHGAGFGVLPGAAVGGAT